MSLDWESPDFDEEGVHKCSICGKETPNARIRALKGEKRCIPCTEQTEVFGVMDPAATKGCGGVLRLSTKKPESENRK